MRSLWLSGVLGAVTCLFAADAAALDVCVQPTRSKAETEDATEGSVRIDDLPRLRISEKKGGFIAKVPWKKKHLVTVWKGDKRVASFYVAHGTGMVALRESSSGGFMLDAATKCRWAPAKKAPPKPAAKPAAKKPAKPAAKAKPAPTGRPGGYQIQVGSFTVGGDAMKLAETLRQKGHRAHLQKVDVKDQGVRFRVRVGPFKTLKSAEEYRRELAAKERLETLIEPPP